jgi:hypothetical protein
MSQWVTWRGGRPPNAGDSIACHIICQGHFRFCTLGSQTSPFSSWVSAFSPFGKIWTVLFASSRSPGHPPPEVVKRGGQRWVGGGQAAWTCLPLTDAWPCPGFPPLWKSLWEASDRLVFAVLRMHPGKSNGYFYCPDLHRASEPVQPSTKGCWESVKSN